MDNITQDQQIIASLGGPTKVVELLGWEKKGGQQRVQNWLGRGIPAAVKVLRPDLFLVPIGPPVPAPTPSTPIAQEASHGA